MSSRGTAFGRVAGSLVAFCAALPAPAQDLPAFSTSYYGTPGLLDMPTAERFPDGEIVTSFSNFASFNRNTLSFQLSPSILGSFRYSRLGDYFPDNSALYDRSFDVSLRLLRESTYAPSVVLGFQDILGTGIYQAEYIVATKTFAEDFRLTAGLGWGRFGTYGSLGSPFGERPAIDVGQGGNVNFKQLFRGPVAPFAGVAWRANDRLTVKAEYSSDAYVQETANGSLDRRSPFNFGVDYKITEGTTVSAGYLYGSEIGFQLNFALNPTRPAYPSGREGAPAPVRLRPTPQENPESWDTAWVTDGETVPALEGIIATALAEDGILLDGISLEGNIARLSIRNTRFRPQPEAIGRTTRLLTRALPASVSTFQIALATEDGLPTTAVTLNRSDVEQLENADAAAIFARAQIEDARALPPIQPSALVTTRRFRWSLAPDVVLGLFDPDQPVRGELNLRLAAEADLAPGLVVSGAISKELIGNLDEIERESDSSLPRVRSDIALYEKEGDPALEHLTMAWYSRPAPEIFSRVTVGYLEPMFGGVSGEVLWRPVDSRLALGVEVNYAQQRDFDQRFGFRDYSVVTGHGSIYYQFNRGYNARLHVGRYLAGDVGATLALSRRFDNGWEVGAYVTKTDVTAEEFGEGSFDKGIELTIPFDWFTGRPTRNRAEAVFRSLARDGGAILDVRGRLYDRVRDSDQQTLEANWGRFWR